MEPTGLADVFKVLIDRADLTLEEARNTAHACKENMAVFRGEGDSLLEHLPLYRHVPRGPPRSKSLCRTGCGRSTLRIFELYPHAGPLCMNCERSRPEYHKIDHTTAKRRFYLSAKDLEAVPTIVRFMGHVRCRYYRPADLLAAALKRHGGTEGLRLRREIGSEAEGGGPEGRREA